MASPAAASAAASSASSAASRLRMAFSDVLKLSKHRLSALVALTASAAFVTRADPQDERPDARAAATAGFTRTLAATTAGTFLSAACANTLNQLYERASDARMARTRLRPLPAARVAPLTAIAFAAASGAAGLVLLAAETNATTTTLAASNVALYAAVYTPLKRVSTLNTPVGAIVGAIPPLMGWAAASGGMLFAPRELGAAAWAGLLFLWQIPHFHALAVMSRVDYARGALKMLAVEHPVANALWARSAARAMLPLGVVFSAAGVVAPVFALESAMLSAWMLRGANAMVRAPTDVSAARALFRASIWHLPLSMALAIFHRVPYAPPTDDSVTDTTPSLTAEPAVTEHAARFLQPSPDFAPFPFLPLPCVLPTVVIDPSDK